MAVDWEISAAAVLSFMLRPLRKLRIQHEDLFGLHHELVEGVEGVEGYNVNYIG
jgi:hypothetical protein